MWKNGVASLMFNVSDEVTQKSLKALPRVGKGRNMVGYSSVVFTLEGGLLFSVSETLASVFISPVEVEAGAFFSP